jgi:glycosyltransferase involved in cell wall biosynthesis
MCQTCRDFELLIIDDSSTDNSHAIIEEYRDKQNISIFYLNNRSHIKNANFALQKAKGKYFMRLDADDRLDPNALLVLSHYRDENENTAAVFPGYYLTDKEGTITEMVRRSEKTEPLKKNDKEPHGACTMIRTQILKDVGGYNEELKRKDGLDLWNKLKNKYPVVSIPTALFYYSQHGEN